MAPLRPFLSLPLAVSCALALSAPGAHAAGTAALVAKAVKDTNTVTSLIHHDSTTIVNPSITLSFTASGMEDEKRNREQDHEDVHVRGLNKQKKVQSLHYTADIIFMNGKTYYRVSTLAKDAWQTASGMKFNDPYTGGWKRGRTTIKIPKGAKFSLVGTSGGETRVRTPFSNANLTGTMDLWITGGAKPYVVKEQIAETSRKVKTATERFTSTLGSFNTTILIQPPTGSGGITT
jgi:hypothetical protein